MSYPMMFEILLCRDRNPFGEIIFRVHSGIIFQKKNDEKLIRRLQEAMFCPRSITSGMAASRWSREEARRVRTPTHPQVRAAPARSTQTKTKTIPAYAEPWFELADGGNRLLTSSVISCTPANGWLSIETNGHTHVVASLRARRSNVEARLKTLTDWPSDFTPFRPQCKFSFSFF